MYLFSSIHEYHAENSGFFGKHLLKYLTYAIRQFWLKFDYSFVPGKIAVIGGCREYTGAPYFAAISALKIVSIVTTFFWASFSFQSSYL